MDTLYQVRGETVQLFTCTSIRLVSYPDPLFNTLRGSGYETNIQCLYCGLLILFLLVPPLSLISPFFSLHPPSLLSTLTLLYQSTLQTASAWTPLTTPPPVLSPSVGTVCSQGFVREHFSSTNPNPSALSSPDWRWAYSSPSSLSLLPPTSTNPHYLPFSSFSPNVSELCLPPSSLTHPHTHVISFFFLLLSLSCSFSSYLIHPLPSQNKSVSYMYILSKLFSILLTKLVFPPG